ncbi:MAG: PAS domain S-box protein [Alphaproteobacteria bacterium]|nr:PAS domain S-box protein [Alphaproteobacteria bacterium]
MTARTEISPLAQACASAEQTGQSASNVSADNLRTCEQLVHELPAMILSVNGHGLVTGANRRWLESWGYEADEITTLHLRDLLTPESHKHLVDTVYPDFFRSGVCRNVNVTCVMKDGARRNGLVSCLGERGENGRIKHTVVVMQDVTREKATEAALRQSEERFRGSFEAAAHGMALASPDGRLMAVNPTLRTLLGSDEMALRRESLQNLVHDGDKPTLLNNIGRILAGELESAQMELRFPSQNGKTIWGLTSISIVRDASGIVAHFVVQIVDLTARRETEERLKTARKMEAVGQLTGGIAHDFNNILQVIIGNLQLVQDAMDSDASKDYAREALEAAGRGTELTKQLLAFSRRQSLAPEKISINQMIGGMNSIIRRTIGESIQFKADLMEKDAQISADLSQLESALMNLAINCRDAMPTGGCLTIETRSVFLNEAYATRMPDITPGHYVLISVSDTGTGIPADVLENVVEPFFTTKDGAQASGLGLSMTYGFIRQSGGHIDVSSEVGRGTSVKMYLPRVDVDSQSDEAVPSTAWSDSARKTVLVVEDQEDVRKVAAGFLKSFGYRVLEAEDGIIALGILQAQPDIDLLFTDIIMPGGMNGFDLSQAACVLNPALKVIHASGYPQGALPHEQIEQISDTLIMKPYHKDELRQVIEDAFSQAKAA